MFSGDVVSDRMLILGVTRSLILATHLVLARTFDSPRGRLSLSAGCRPTLSERPYLTPSLWMLRNKHKAIVERHAQKDVRSRTCARAVRFERTRVACHART